MAWDNYKKSSVKLPNHHHKDDAKWIEEILLSMKEEYRIKACVKYNDVYQNAFKILSFKSEGDYTYVYFQAYLADKE